MSALLLMCLLAAPAPVAPTALEKASADLGEQLVKRLPDATSATLAVAVGSADSPELAFLLRVTARVEGAEVVLSGDVVPTWVNFWAGKDPIRKAGGGPIAARAPTDAQVLTLARLPLVTAADKPPHGEIATRFALRAIARIPDRVVAITVGDLDGDKQAEIVVLTPAQVIVLKPSGQIVARRDLASLPRSPRPPREPAGALAIDAGEPGKPRVLSFSFARTKGEALELSGSELKPVQTIEAPAACSGEAGVLRGIAQPGKNLFAPELRLGAKSGTLPFGAVWDAYCLRRGVPAGPAWIDEVNRYEKDILSGRT